MGQRGLLLDRDGVINVDRGYIGTQERFEFIPGIADFLRTLQDKGFRLAILTNQSGVARGLFQEQDHKRLTEWMIYEFRKQGVNIDLELACFEHPDGKDNAYRRESFWRKPNPGMVLEAVQKLRLDSSKSVFLGDSLRDLEAAQAGKIATCLWLTTAEHTSPSGIQIVHDFNQALQSIPFA